MNDFGEKNLSVVSWKWVANAKRGWHLIILKMVSAKKAGSSVSTDYQTKRQVAVFTNFPSDSY